MYKSIILMLLLSACASKQRVFIGTVDSRELRVCVVQLEDNSIIHVHPAICDKLKEGDVIEVTREKR